MKNVHPIAMTMFVLGVFAAAQGKARQADFNGDGIADLAVGVRGEDVSGQESAGAVHVFYGEDHEGLTADDDDFLTQDSSGIQGTAGANEYFGEVLAAGDFDGDGFTDLAIGVPQDTIAGTASAGAVSVIYGSAGGLTTNDKIWHRGISGVLGDLQTNGLFGEAVAAGDFDGDGFDDLAVGVPGQTVGGDTFAGEVHILYGGNNGLTASGDQVFNQDDLGQDDEAEPSNQFGATLAAGDFNGDDRDDLAIGVPEEDLGGDSSVGFVHVLYGRSSGLSLVGNQLFSQDTDDVGGLPELGHHFGYSLAAGDFDHNGKDDLAIGAYGDTVNEVASAGSVVVLYGRSSGLRTVDSDYWHQDVPGIADEAEAGGEYFGFAVAAGDFNKDGRDDLAIGVPNEIVGTVENAGAVHVLKGSSSGLTATGDQLWHQDSSGITDSAQYNDFFGGALTAGDYDDDGRDDLAIGVVEESFSGAMSAGAVAVLFGASNGLTGSGDQFGHQNTDGVPDAPSDFEYFGGAVR